MRRGRRVARDAEPMRRYQGTGQPRDPVSRNQRFGLLMIALTVVVFTAHSTNSFLLIDACLDAGGRYLSGPPRCDLGGAAARELGTLPRRGGGWLLTLVPSAVAGWLVYVTGRAALRRASRDAG